MKEVAKVFLATNSDYKYTDVSLTNQLRVKPYGVIKKKVNLLLPRLYFIQNGSFSSHRKS